MAVQCDSGSYNATKNYAAPEGVIGYIYDLKTITVHDGRTKGGRIVGSAAYVDLGTTTGLIPTADQVPTLAFTTGMIVAFSGLETNIPAGWALCNGQNNTPDLRDKFIVGGGTGSSYAFASSGGAATQTTNPAGSHTHGGYTDSQGAHSHTGTATYEGAHTHALTIMNDGGHSHTGNTDTSADHTHGFTVPQVSAGNYTATAAGNYGGQLLYGAGTGGWTSITANGGSHSHGLTTSYVADHSHAGSTAVLDGAHLHDISTSYQAGHVHSLFSDTAPNHTHTFDNRPPYYALLYIMKT